LSGPEDRSPSQGFAALVDVTSPGPDETPRPAAADRREPAQPASRATEPNQDPRATAADRATTQQPPHRHSGRVDTDKAPRSNDGDTPKPAKAAKPADDASQTEGTENDNSGAATAVAVALAAAMQPATPPSGTNAPPPETAGSAPPAPLTIAATAIATSAQAAALPDDTSAMAEAVADAAASINATNFTIAKTIATTPVPAATLSPEGEANVPTPQLAAAVAAATPAIAKIEGKADGKTGPNAAAPEATARTSGDAKPQVDLDAVRRLSPSSRRRQPRRSGPAGRRRRQ